MESRSLLFCDHNYLQLNDLLSNPNFVAGVAVPLLSQLLLRQAHVCTARRGPARNGSLQTN